MAKAAGASNGRSTKFELSSGGGGGKIDRVEPAGIIVGLVEYHQFQDDKRRLRLQDLESHK